MTGHEIRVELLAASRDVLDEWDAYALISARANANSAAVERLRKAVVELAKHEASLP